MAFRIDLLNLKLPFVTIKPPKILIGFLVFYRDTFSEFIKRCYSRL